jgi:RING finger protein 113A
MNRREKIVDRHKTICKPFKETGYCGYGSTCKYSHDRYIETEEDADIYTEATSCAICNKDLEDEVVTECGHSFCSSCAFSRYQVDDRCYTCRRPTHGRFREKSWCRPHGARD